MPVPEQTPFNSSTGNGVTTVFPYTFKILVDADLQVLVDGTELELTTDYTVSGAGDETGGNVTFLSAPANGTTVVRRRDMALERTTEYQPQGDLAAGTLNDDFDATVLMMQQVSEKLGRSVRAPAGELALTELPVKAERANLLLGFDADGDPVAVESDVPAANVSSFMVNVLSAADAPSALSAIGMPLHFLNGLRLSLTSNVPVTTADVNAASIVRVVPYKHNVIALYDASTAKWRLVRLASGTGGVQGSFATASRPLDIYASYNSPTSVNFYVSSWTNDTTRYEAQGLQDNVVVLASNHEYRFLGSVYVDAANKITDSLTKRHVWNHDNRVHRPIALACPTSSWSYTTATVRQANADTGNQVQVLTGLAEDAVRLDLQVCAQNTNSNVKVQAGFGVNATNVFSGSVGTQTLLTATYDQQLHARYEDVPAVGLNTFAMCEWSQATGVTSWAGTGSGKNIVGSCLA